MVKQEKLFLDDAEGKKGFPDFAKDNQSASEIESDILKSIESAEKLNRQYSATVSRNNASNESSVGQSQFSG